MTVTGEGFTVAGGTGRPQPPAGTPGPGPLRSRDGLIETEDDLHEVRARVGPGTVTGKVAVEVVWADAPPAGAYDVDGYASAADLPAADGRVEVRGGHGMVVASRTWPETTRVRVHVAVAGRDAARAGTGPERVTVTVWPQVGPDARWTNGRRDGLALAILDREGHSRFEPGTTPPGPVWPRSRAGYRRLFIDHDYYRFGVRAAGLALDERGQSAAEIGHVDGMGRTDGLLQPSAGRVAVETGKEAGPLVVDVRYADSEPDGIHECHGLASALDLPVPEGAVAITNSMFDPVDTHVWEGVTRCRVHVEAVGRDNVRHAPSPLYGMDPNPGEVFTVTIWPVTQERPWWSNGRVDDKARGMFGYLEPHEVASPVTEPPR